MQDGVGGAAHGNVHGHGVLERFQGGNAAGQHAGVIVLVVALGVLDNLAAGFQEQLLTVGMGSQQRAVARKGQADGLGQAVHGVGGEHAGAGATGGAGAALVFFDHLVGGGRIGRNHHGIDQVQLVFRQLGFTGFHGAAGHKDGRNVQAQGGHQHARGDFVAVGDAHQRIGTVGIGHVLYGVGNDLPGGQGVQHAVVAHGDTVVHGDGVELLGHTTGGFDFATDQLA